MRELAEGMRRGDPSAASGGTQREMARALDRMADRMGQTSGARDQEGQQVADALSRTRELREKLGDLQKQIEAVSKQAGEQGSPGKGTASPSSARGRESQQPPSEAQRQLADLRRQYLDALRQAGTQGGDQAQGAGMANAATTPVGQQMVTSAPGTEAFKQDFSKWESLHKEVRLGLEQLEASLSQRLVESAARDRLRSGADDRAPAAYRGSIDRYFRSLAQEPR